MNISYLSHMTDPLRDLLASQGRIIKALRDQRALRPVLLTCDIVPVEILLAAGISVLGQPEIMDEWESPFDFSIGLPGHMNRHPGKNFEFSPPHGWGEPAQYESLRRLDALLKEITGSGISSVNTDALREACGLYTKMRRLIRGIRSARRQNPALLAQVDLFSVYESARCLPPEEVIPHLEPLLAEMNSAPGHGSLSFRFTAMISSHLAPDLEILDQIEDEGILIAEDHTCSGARLFDISYNPEAPDLLSEVIHAFTFKVYCHHVRPPGERYELLYKMLRTHDIECVFFIADDLACEESCGFTELGARLMRIGVDPLFCGPDHLLQTAADYAVRGAVRIIPV